MTAEADPATQVRNLLAFVERSTEETRSIGGETHARAIALRLGGRHAEADEITENYIANFFQLLRWQMISEDEARKLVKQYDLKIDGDHQGTSS